MINYGYGVSLGSLDGYQDGIRKWRNSPAIRDWCRQHTMISFSEQSKWESSLRDRQDVKMFNIYKGEEYANEHVGVCGFTDINLLHRRAEFSLYIAPEHQRKGYAKAGLKTLFQHGYLDWGFNVIWGETFDKNPAFKLFTDLGMKHEGTRHDFYWKGGKFIDAHLVSMSRDEWERQRPCWG